MKIQPLSASLLLIIAASTPNAATSEPQALNGVQVAVGDCIVAKPFKGSPEADTRSLVDAIASSAISQGVNYLGKALTEAGATKTWTATGSRNFQAASDKFPSCVQVVRGRFAPNGESGVGWTAPGLWPSDLDAKLRARGIALLDAPLFIFEGKLVSATDKSALTVRPVLVTFTEPIGTRFWRPEKDRGVALFMAITAPGTKPSLDTNPAATLIFGAMGIGSSIKFDESPSYTSPFESPWFTLAKADTAKPMTVTAMVSETQGASEFLTFVGAVLSDSKVVTAANADLGKMLIPSQVAQAESDQATKNASAANNADTTFQTMIAKLTACKAATPITATAAATETKVAMRNYMLADKASPSPQGLVADNLIDKIDLRTNSTKLTAACTEVLDALLKK
jgi:hypothetical protein